MSNASRPSTTVAADAILSLSVIVVSFNVRELLVHCLESLTSDLAGLAAEVVVADNASIDGTVDAVRQRFPRVRVLENDRNLGFGAANNQALKITSGQAVLFLNPDTEMRPGAASTLVRHMTEHPDVGVVGPRLHYPNGIIQSSRRSFPTPLTGLIESTIVQRWFPKTGLLRRYYRDGNSDDQTQDVDWLVGACLLARRETIDRVGGFDERFFMYSEELDWCYRVREDGWRIVYLPDAEVIHHEGRSSEQNRARRSQTFLESKSRFYEKRFGADVGRALRICLLALTFVEAAEELAKLCVGHRVALRWERLRAFAHVSAYQIRQLAGFRPG